MFGITLVVFALLVCAAVLFAAWSLVKVVSAASEKRPSEESTVKTEKEFPDKNLMVRYINWLKGK